MCVIVGVWSLQWMCDCRCVVTSVDVCGDFSGLVTSVEVCGDFSGGV